MKFPAKRERNPVLVVGCGPVGLATAITLAARGVPVRCVDRAAGPSPLSKALLVWPRTLQVIQSLYGEGSGIDDRSMPVSAFRYYSSARQVARIGFARHTRPVILPQPDVEWLLRDALRRAGMIPEWGTTLTGLTQHDDGVTAHLHADGTAETADFSYVVGCDGASSTVRGLIDVEFEGSTYPNTFLLSDAMVDGPIQHDAVHYYCSPRGVLVMIGLPGGRFRVFTSARPDFRPEDATLDAMQAMTDERGPGGLRLHDPAWTTAFSLHARRADRYQVGRVFLAGDAAHAHSPAGGQGLNTGVTDAHNLGWKLALAWHGQASKSLLGSYEPERRQVADAVLRQGDLQMRAWLVRGPVKVAARDMAVRAVSAAGLFGRDYVPWLAGLHTVYGSVTGNACDALGVTRRRATRPARQAERMFVPGALIPRLRVRDAATGQWRELEKALSHRGYTLLIVTGLPDRGQGTLGGPAGARGDLPDLGELADVRVLAADRTLRAMPPPATADAAQANQVLRPESSHLVLIRPDHYVAACAPMANSTAVSTYLETSLDTSGGPTTAKAKVAP